MIRIWRVAAVAALAFGSAPALAQNADSDLAPPGGVEETSSEGAPLSGTQPVQNAPPVPAPTGPAPTAPANDITISQATARDKQRVASDDVLVAAEGVFGRSAAGLAGIIENILRDQGEPIGYITGAEGSGAFIFGAKYGSGTMFHKIEGQSKVYWRGPTVGFDAGADANKVFVLVYNLDDGDELYKAYPAAEGKAYLVGGFTAAYLKRKDVVLIPVRLGAGVRLGANIGYMRFSKKETWIPF